MQTKRPISCVYAGLPMKRILMIEGSTIHSIVFMDNSKLELCQIAVKPRSPLVEEGERPIVDSISLSSQENENVKSQFSKL